MEIIGIAALLIGIFIVRRERIKLVNKLHSIQDH